MTQLDSSTLAECLLRGTGAVFLCSRRCIKGPILIEVKLPTGEPDAGEPPVWFGGGRGRIQSSLPTPIQTAQDRGLLN